MSQILQFKSTAQLSGLTPAQGTAKTTLLDVFERIAVINARDGADRQQTLQSLAKLGLDYSERLIDFIQAEEPGRADGWASSAAAANFQAHCCALNHAVENGWNSILVWDVRAGFADQFAPLQESVIRALKETHWDLLYLSAVDCETGGRMPRKGEDEGERKAGPLRRVYGSVTGATAYGVSRPLLDELAATANLVLERPVLLASPFTPTASSFEPDAISIVLSKTLRANCESRGYRPNWAFQAAWHQEDCEGTADSGKVRMLFHANGAGQ